MGVSPKDDRTLDGQAGTVLIIRQEQIASLDSTAEKRYCEELRQYLGARFSQSLRRLDEAVLLDRISVSVRTARTYGVRTGEGVLAYVRLALAAGPAFNTDPQVRMFLAQPSGNPDERVHRLFTRIVTSLQTTPAKYSGSTQVETETRT
jgi:hypothetical protein